MSLQSAFSYFSNLFTHPEDTKPPKYAPPTKEKYQEILATLEQENLVQFVQDDVQKLQRDLKQLKKLPADSLEAHRISTVMAIYALDLVKKAHSIKTKKVRQQWFQELERERQEAARQRKNAEQLLKEKEKQIADNEEHLRLLQRQEEGLKKLNAEKEKQKQQHDLFIAAMAERKRLAEEKAQKNQQRLRKESERKQREQQKDEESRKREEQRRRQEQQQAAAEEQRRRQEQQQAETLRQEHYATIKQAQEELQQAQQTKEELIRQREEQRERLNEEKRQAEQAANSARDIEIFYNMVCDVDKIIANFAEEDLQKLQIELKTNRFKGDIRASVNTIFEKAKLNLQKWNAQNEIAEIKKSLCKRLEIIRSQLEQIIVSKSGQLIENQIDTILDQITNANGKELGDIKQQIDILQKKAEQIIRDHA